MVRGSVAAASVLAGTHLVPSVAAIGPLRRVVLPRLSGVGRRGHVALSFDDGPVPVSTPQFLDELSRLGVRATFFVLGAQLSAYPQLGKQIVADGHEIAVHGWTHRPHLLRTPWGIHADLLRAVQCVESVTGAAPGHWRPPHGIPTGTSLVVAWRLGLHPVLWTADGRDWQGAATARSVQARVDAQLGDGGTVLLHDADTTSAPGSWRAALAALEPLVSGWRARGWQVGPLAEHWAAHAAR